METKAQKLAKKLTSNVITKKDVNLLLEISKLEFNPFSKKELEEKINEFKSRFALTEKEWGIESENLNENIFYQEEDLIKFSQIILSQYKIGNTNIEQLDIMKETLKAFNK